MLNKKQRRENWPGIEAALRTASPVYVDKYNKTPLRRYYVEGTVAPCNLGPYANPMPLGLCALLLLEPNATKEKWKEWEEEQSKRTGYHTGFTEIQGDVKHYFGENTVFEGRESEIYEFFYRKLALKIDPDEHPHFLLSLGLSLDHISRIQVNPYCQVWRSDQEKLEQLRDMPAERFKFDPSVAPGNWDYHSKIPYDPLWLARSLCPIEWAYRHPEHFDPVIKPIVEYFRDFYVNSHESIRDVYEAVVDTNLANWAEITGAGGQVSVCIEYESAEHLEAMLPLLDRSTRYPCKSDDPLGMVRAGLPVLTGREGRESYMTLRDLWGPGFSVTRHLVIAENILFLQFTAPLRRDRMYYPLVVLSSDVTDLEERIKVRKTLPDDEFGKKRSVGKVVYLIEPLAGRWRVGAVERDDHPDIDSHSWVPAWVELHQGDNSLIDGIVKVKNSEELMVELLKKYQMIRQEGGVLKSVDVEGSIDGFTTVTNSSQINW